MIIIISITIVTHLDCLLRSSTLQGGGVNLETRVRSRRLVTTRVTRTRGLRLLRARA